MLLAPNIMQSSPYDIMHMKSQLHNAGQSFFPSTLVQYHPLCPMGDHFSGTLFSSPGTHHDTGSTGHQEMKNQQQSTSSTSRLLHHNGRSSLNSFLVAAFYYPSCCLTSSIPPPPTSSIAVPNGRPFFRYTFLFAAR